MSLLRGHRARRVAGRVGFGALVAVIVGLIATSAVLAQDQTLGGKIRSGSTVVVPATETVNSSLYISGGTVSVDGTVNGDVVAAGGNVTVGGPVTGDVIAAGGTVTITGAVKDSVRVAGGTVVVGGNVAGDVLVAGGRIDVTGQIGQDLIIYGGQVTVSGSVAGNVTGNASAYSRTGTVGGADTVSVAPPSAPPERRAVDEVGAIIQQILAVLIFGVLALWLAPRLVDTAERLIRERPATAFGWGIVGAIGFLVLVVVISIVAVLLAIGLGLLGAGQLAALDVFAAFVAVAGLSIAFAATAAFLVDAIVGLALARLVWRRSPPVTDGTDRSRAVVLMAVGAIVIVLLTALPIVGGLIKLVVVLLGLGALIAAWRERRRRARVPPPAAAPAVA